ncbi:hypothetical protein [Parabacteroides pacaensis]|uniref:hypothetical protein n=1 Tax=Parabacteroides pacaensis TaxID=2086575 RepID=UPI000D1020F9|nr:hypothetical protein [Parabacteroides pacaensis]
MTQKYRLNTKQKKELFLKALDARMLNVTSACKAASISRTLAYKWKSKDADFAEKWKEVEESFYDKLETTMFAKALTEQDNTMLIWLSKTKMKHRGYVEKTESDLNVNGFEKLMQELPDDDE